MPGPIADSSQPLQSMTALPLDHAIIQHVQSPAVASLVISAIPDMTAEQAFDFLPAACKSDNFELVKAIVDRVGFSLCDEEGNNILHIISALGSRSMLEYAGQQMQKSYYLRWNRVRASVGLSPAMLNYQSSFAELAASPLGKKNQQGLYPLQLIHHNPQLEEEYYFSKPLGFTSPSGIVGSFLEWGKLVGNGEYIFKENFEKELMLGGNVNLTLPRVTYDTTPRGWDAMERALDAGFNVNMTFQNGTTYFTMACVESFIPSAYIDLMIAHGAKVNERDSTGKTPLMHACESGNIHTIERLLAAGAHLEATDGQGKTALYLAVEAGRHDVLLKLLEAGANPNPPVSSGLKTPMTLLIRNAIVSPRNALLSIEKLRALNVPFDAPADDVQTHLAWACIRGEASEVRALLAAGADADGYSKHGLTPLIWACIGEKHEIIETLLQFGAKIDLEIGGSPLISPLSCAAERSDSTMIQRLLQANPDASTLAKSHALNNACWFGNAEIAKILLDAGGLSAMQKCEVGTNHYRMPMYYESAYQVALRRDSFHGTDVLRRLQILDNGMTIEYAMLMELCHRFNVKGVVTLGDTKVSLEGWFQENTVTLTHAHIRDFYDTLAPIATPGVLSAENWAGVMRELSLQQRRAVVQTPAAHIASALREAEAAIAVSTHVPAAQQQLNQGKAAGVAITITEPGGNFSKPHAVSIAIKPLTDGTWEVALINKGFGAHKIGIRFFKTTKSPVDAISRSMTYEFFNRGIIEAWELTEEVYYPLMPQKVGNCALASINALEIALLFMELKPKMREEQTAFALAHAIKKMRCRDSRLEDLRIYLDYHEVPRNFPPAIDYLKDVLEYKQNKEKPSDEDRLVIEMLTEWLPRHGSPL